MLLSRLGNSLGILLKALLFADQVVQEISQQLQVLLRMGVATGGGQGVVDATQLSFVLRNIEEKVGEFFSMSCSVERPLVYLVYSGETQKRVRHSGFSMATPPIFQRDE